MPSTLRPTRLQIAQMVSVQHQNDSLCELATVSEPMMEWLNAQVSE
jgi:hypothetical protein